MFSTKAKYLIVRISCVHVKIQADESNEVTIINREYGCNAAPFDVWQIRNAAPFMTISIPDGSYLQTFSTI